jgi:hypothetical protein
MLNKDQLIFDPSEIADSDSVGAYLRSSDGTLLTHSSFAGSVEALDVNLAGSTGTIDTDPGPIQYVLDGSPVTVLEDTVTPANNRPLPVKLTSVTGDINITAGDLNVQLEHTGANPDSVQIGDGTEIVSITPNNDMQVADFYDTGLANSAVTVDTTVGGTQLVSSALANRKTVEIQNLGNRAIFLGLSGVTSSTGYRIPARGSFSKEIGPNLDLYAIAAGGSQDIRVLELS